MSWLALFLIGVAAGVFCVWLGIVTGKRTWP